MKKYRPCVYSVILFLALCRGIPSLSQSAEGISYYTNGEGKLSVNAFPSSVDFSLSVTGSTTQKTLLMRVDKAGSGMKKFMVPLSPDGSFRFVWLFKGGPGTYNVVFFGSPQPKALNYTGLAYAKVKVTGTVPPTYPGLALNDRVLAFVNAVIGTRVGSGECWDLAQEALDANMADWTRPFSFGVRVDPEKEPVLPGDIIQFTGVKTEERLDDGSVMTHTLGLPDHTAIIYEVTGPRRYKLAHQNVDGVRTVMISAFDLDTVRSGKIRIFRPVAAAIVPEK